MKAFAWVEPSTLEEALAAGAAPGALYKAGGIDVSDRLKEHLDAPETLVNIRRLPELDFVREEPGALVLGPGVTLLRVAEDVRVQKSARALALAASLAATPQIRATATLGGNLAQRPRCWYFRSELFSCLKKGGDACFAQQGEHEAHAIFDNTRCAAVHPSGTATALMALGARLTLQGQKGRREVGLEDFFVSPSQDVTRENVLKPGELIVEIRVPASPGSGYIKLMQKQSFDWPMADAAAHLRMVAGVVQEVRVVLGAVAPTPRRAVEVEKAILGKPLSADTVAAAAVFASQGATPLPNNGHKRELAQVAARRALLAAGGLA